MNTLYFATHFKPEMVEKNLSTLIQETNANGFKDVVEKAGKKGYIIKFAVTSSVAVYRLLKILEMEISDVVGRGFETEELKCGDVVLLSSNQSLSKFRYFILTFHQKKNRETF